MARLSKKSAGQIANVIHYINRGNIHLAAATLSCLHRSGNTSERKACEEVLSDNQDKFRNVIEVVNNCMVTK